MNILLLNSARAFIGEAAHCLGLAREFRARGHNVLLAVRAGFELEQRARAEGVPVLPLTFMGHFAPMADLRDARTIARVVREQRIDIVHCHRGKDHWTATTALLGRRGAPPVVRTRHVVMPMKPHPLNRWLLRRRTAFVVAVSRMAADSLGPMRAMLGDRLRVIYSAVDTARFNPSHRSAEWRAAQGVPPDGLLVGMVARIQNIKGQRFFIEAAGRLAPRFPQARFLVAGRGHQHDFDHMRRQAEQLGIADRIIFHGWLDDVATAIASLDVSVLASLGSEGSSRISYETMASGVPLVATTVGCIPEIAEDGETALLAPPGDAEALAAAIARLLESPGLRHDLAGRALAHVRGHHGLDRWVEDMLAVYRGVLAR